MTVAAVRAATGPMIELATEYAAVRGWPVFPCSQATKAPLVSSGFKSASKKPQQIAAWWRQYPNAMMGVPTGNASGFWVLDIDCKEGKDGFASLAKLEADHGPLPATLACSTPSGGKHYYFTNDDAVENSASRLALGIDVRGEGGYVIVPGSVRDDGCYYEWDNEAEEIANAPPWLITAMAKPKAAKPSPVPNGQHGSNPPYVDAVVKAEIEKLISTTTGRNTALYTCALKLGSLIGPDLSHAEAEDHLDGAAVAGGYVDKDGEAAARATIRSGLEAGMANPRTIPEPSSGGERVEFKAANDNDPAAAKEKRLPNATHFVWKDPATLPRRECLYGNHLYRKFVSATFGAGGGGKSNLVIVDALAMISKRPLLQHSPAAPLNVWYVNLEDPSDEISRRVTAAALHHKIDPAILNERLFIDSGRDQQFVVLKNTGKGSSVVEPVVNSIIRELIANKIDVLIIDPFISTHEVEENDNTKIQQVAAQWVRIADEANCAVELVHHVAKSAGGQHGLEVTAESGRGAGALKDKARSIRVINGMSESEATKCGIHRENRFDYFRVGNAKSNMSRRTGNDDWRRMVSVRLGNGGSGGNLSFLKSDNVGVVEFWKFDAAGQSDVTEAQMAAITDQIATGTYRSDAQATNWAGNMVAEQLGLDAETDKAQIKMLLKSWMGERFVVVDGLDGTRKTVKFLALAP